ALWFRPLGPDELPAGWAPLRARRADLGLDDVEDLVRGEPTAGAVRISRRAADGAAAAPARLHRIERGEDSRDVEVLHEIASSGDGVGPASVRDRARRHDPLDAATVEVGQRVRVIRLHQ